MNFLAHAHLSGESSDIIFGNFIADSVKGSYYKEFRTEIMIGILLHREIDTFTDRHPVVKQSRDLIRGSFGKFSGIVVDIYYDHFLARNWYNYSDQELVTFSSKVYSILARRFLLLPNRIKKLLPFLIGQNWLSGYANFNDLTRVFKGMDRRTGYISGMGDSVEVLMEKYTPLYEDFIEFYQELESFSKRRLTELIHENNA